MTMPEPTPHELQIEQLTSSLTRCAKHNEELLASLTQSAKRNLQLADAVLSLAQSNTALGNRLTRLTDEYSEVRKALVSSIDRREADKEKHLEALNKLSTSFQMLASDLNNVERDVREASNPRLQLPVRDPHEEEGDRRATGAAKFLNTLNRVSPRTQLVVIVLALIAGVAIAAVYILKGGG